MADEFYPQARDFWDELRQEKIPILTTNFVLDETYTLIRSRLGKAAACRFHDDLFSSYGFSGTERVTLADEEEAWKLFRELPGRGISFTDCTSFAVMKRLGLKEAFTFDRDFEKAGFRLLP